LYTDPDGTNHYPWNRGEDYYIGDVEKVEIEFETDIAHQFLTMCTEVQSQNGDFYSGHGTTNWLALGSIKVRKDSVILKGVPYVNGGYGLFEQATGSYVVFGINNIVYLSDYLKLSNIYDLGNGYFAGFIKEHYNSTFVDTNDSNRVKGCLKLDFQIITSTTYGGPTTDYNMSVEFRPEAVGGLSGNYKTLVFTYPPEFLTIPKLYILSVRDAVIPL
jgi:hypothetical protein